MKKLLYLLTFVAFNAGAQNILLVDDNDNITDNSDTLIATLLQTDYSTFTVYNVTDSLGETPSSSLMEDFDLVIWYASTDGAGLGFWTAADNGDLISYLAGGGRLWVIGSDLLYDEYPATPAAFAVNDFAYDFMGLASYDVQSYGNDGSLGVPQVDVTSAAPGYFADEIAWIFSTHWWVDGVTSRSGATDLYTMGPANYVLAGDVCMTHFTGPETNVLSTFFDPALINTRQNRAAFLEASIFYLLGTLGVDEASAQTISVYPNPATGQIKISSGSTSEAAFEVFSAAGTSVLTGKLINGEATADLSSLAPGLYLLKIAGNNQTRKLVKQ